MKIRPVRWIFTELVVSWGNLSSYRFLTKVKDYNAVHNIHRLTSNIFTTCCLWTWRTLKGIVVMLSIIALVSWVRMRSTGWSFVVNFLIMIMRSGSVFEDDPKHYQNKSNEALGRNDIWEITLHLQSSVIISLSVCCSFALTTDLDVICDLWLCDKRKESGINLLI